LRGRPLKLLHDELHDTRRREDVRNGERERNMGRGRGTRRRGREEEAEEESEGAARRRRRRREGGEKEERRRREGGGGGRVGG